MNHNSRTETLELLMQNDPENRDTNHGEDDYES
jgi:hypothetical protein